MCFASISPYGVHKNWGRKQTPEQIRKRVESASKTKSKWTVERHEQWLKRAAKARSEWTPKYREEVKLKTSEGHRGQVAWNKGKSCPQLSGENHGMYRKHHTSESIEKIRSKKIGIKQSLELIQKRIDGRAGYQHSEETKRQIRETNLKTWSIPEVRNQSVGENSATWKNGISFVPYPVEFNTIFKERIRDRDGRRCKACGKTEEENGQRLDVHHIDHDKNNLSDENLFSLCIPCHRKT